MLRVQSSGQLAVGVWGGYIQGDSRVNDGCWHHVAAVLSDDGSPSINEVKLYVDGELQTTVYASSSQAINTDDSQDVLVGTINTNGSLSNYFKGLIDNVRIYDRALSSLEVARMADAVTVAYWRFEEGPVNASVSHGGADSGVFYPGV
jgi:hypothetical protein